MSSPVNILNADLDISPLENMVIKDGLFIPVPYSEVKKFSQQHISLFCHKHALYQFPTTELIDYLKEETASGLTIEVGSGNGCIGRSLGIKMTDNFQQTWPDVVNYYKTFKQPLISYGKDVEEINGNDAVKKYTPKNVIACWVTQPWDYKRMSGNYWGIDENKMFVDGIEKYIHVGNENTHSTKEILSLRKYKSYKFDWLLSRSLSKEANIIYIIT